MALSFRAREFIEWRRFHFIGWRHQPRPLAVASAAPEAIRPTFVLAELATRYPDLIERIARAKAGIASPRLLLFRECSWCGDEARTSNHGDKVFYCTPACRKAMGVWRTRRRAAA